MLRLQSKITFTKEDGTNFVFNFCQSVETSESWEDYTSTAKVVVPRKVKFKGKNLFVGSDAILKRGDQIKIELGYFPKIRTVFEGYITKIGSNIPCVLECEDKMFLLKNTRCTYPKKVGLITTGKNGKALKKPKVVSAAISLNDLLGNILPDEILYECVDVNLGSFRCNNASVSQILDELKSEYGLFSYFREGKLYVGLPSNAARSSTQTFTFEETIIDEEELEWQEASDISIKVKAISMQPDNSKKEIEVGDSDGAQRTFYTYNATDAGLKEFANLELNKVRYTGFRGTVETFGEPYVRHGDIAEIISNKLPERNGNYLIKTVKRKFGVGIGYRQFLGLEAKV